MPHLPPDRTPTTVRDELAAMRKIVAALETLDPPARERVVTWVADAVNIENPQP